jgi:ribosomal-protein-alanine N-acetyltransferase
MIYLYRKRQLSMSIDAAFTHFPSLTTNRLHLRHIQPTDTEALFAIVSDPLVTEPYGREPHQSLEETQALFQRRQALYERREAILWGMTLKGADTVIGSCTLFDFDPDFHCAQTGYELHRAYWRQGLMAEAMSAVLTFGFSELGLHRIEANVAASNTPSRALLRKLGFTFEGNLRQRYVFRAHFEDEHCFGLLKDEWVKVG